MPMSRAEAICACNNIVEILEEMGDHLPDDFASGIGDKAKGMLDFILKTGKVTDKMSQALRNMWGGIQKWNHNDYNNNLFDGIEGVIKELQNVQATYDKAEGGEESSNDTADEDSGGTGAVATGIEDFDLSEDPRYSVASDMAKLQAKSLREAPTVNVIRGEDVKKVLSQPVNITKTGLPLEDIIKVREEMISQALNQVHEKHISAIDTKGIRHGIIQDIMKATKSDRTTQLLWAAFYAGKVSGILQFGEALSTEAGKK